MKKSTKGALAAAAAGSLLVGGAGSLAYWTGTGTVNGATISSGDFTLDAVDCDPGAGTGSVWTIDGVTFDPASEKLVPGDTLTKVCTTTLTLIGTHIGASLGISTPGFAAATGLSGELAPTAAFTVDGAPATSVNDAGTYDIEVTVEVPFDEDATNASRNLSATLNAITISATQTNV